MRFEDPGFFFNLRLQLGSLKSFYPPNADPMKRPGDQLYQLIILAILSNYTGYISTLKIPGRENAVCAVSWPRNTSFRIHTQPSAAVAVGLPLVPGSCWSCSPSAVVGSSTTTQLSTVSWLLSSSSSSGSWDFPLLCFRYSFSGTYTAWQVY